jgi:hypothetical protein
METAVPLVLRHHAGDVEAPARDAGARQAWQIRPAVPPYLWLFQVLLPLLAPLIDVFSIYGIAFLNPVQVGAFWLSFTALQMLIAGYALRLDGERLRALWVLPFQLIVYRLLMYLVTIQSVIAALLGTRQRWQATQRNGVFTDTATSGQPVASTR